MKMLNSFLIAVAAMLLTGCLPDRLSPTGNAAKFYQPYEGMQTNWPTADSVYVTRKSGFTIYHGYPPYSYTVLGRFDRPNIPLFRVIKCARHFNADAIILSEEPFIEQRLQPGLIIGNPNLVGSTPWTSRSVKRLDATAYLIQSNLPASH